MMEQIPENSAGQGESPAPAAALPLGKTLREARERLGLSVADVSGQTKLAPRQIEALEAEDFRSLPEMPFVRGFVRSYAKILQLDAQPLLASVPQENASQKSLVPNSVEAPFPVASSPQRQNLIWLGAALLLSVVVVAFSVWNFTTPPAKPEAAQVETPVALPERVEVIPASPVAEAAVPPAAMTARSSTEAQAPAAKAATPPAVQQAQAEKPAAQPDIPLQSATLRLTFGEESWTEIRGKDDKILSSQVNLPGSELRLKGQGPFSLVIGHAASARLYYRGKQIDLTPFISSSNEVARLTLE
ncbi:helix-turn-helix domain-containing protein [Candidatus Ferrigenium straubiae]|jgi:cytoskeleton protein RodZ|uniref:helix-turn-helix domain-containing protein n=1 Tax=Candidatus Ferrigenium straubiae TaxID=2919506 RepID=UPI003F4ABD76